MLIDVPTPRRAAASDYPPAGPVTYARFPSEEFCPASVAECHSPDPDPDGCCSWCGWRMPDPTPDPSRPLDPEEEAMFEEAAARRFSGERGRREWDLEGQAADDDLEETL